MPILATHAGAVLGAWVYYLAIGKCIGVEDTDSNSLDLELHWHKDDTENTEEGETDAEEADPLPVKHGYNGDGRVPTYVQVNMMDLIFQYSTFPPLVPQFTPKWPGRTR